MKDSYEQPVRPDADQSPSSPLPPRVVIGFDDGTHDAHLITYVASLGVRRDQVARVVHVVEHSPYPGSLLLDGAEEARSFVDEAVFVLRMAGVGASGVVRHAPPSRIARVLTEEASSWGADSIIVSARRPRCWRAPFGRGVRERLLRRSSYPIVLVSPRYPSEPPRHSAGDQMFA
jgi:nucleotide-binding universal stress UspA family protein